MTQADTLDATAQAVNFPALDAVLIDLFRRWEQNEAAHNATPETTAEDDAAFLERASDLEWKIAETPASTIQGLVVKLAIACGTGCSLTFGDDDAPGKAARSALRDARKMAGLDPS